MKRSSVLKPLSAALTAALLLVLPGCPANTEAPVQNPESKTGTWVGTLDGSDAFVAVVADGSQVVAYVCESGKKGEWFAGTQSGNALGLENKAGTALALQLGDSATGRLTFADGTELTFTAAATTEEVLHRAETVQDEGDAGVVVGWIRVGDRTQGSLSLTTTSGTTLQSAPDLQLNNSTISGLYPTPMTPTTLSAAQPNNVTFYWAAMGDSYAAGEGNPEKPIDNPANHDDFTGLRWGDDSSHFVPMNNIQQDDDAFTCHRSDHAPSVKVNARLAATYPSIKFKLGFTACSGAQTYDLLHPGYTGPGVKAAARRGHPVVLQPAQLDRVEFFKNTYGRLDMLYFSIGGNDFGFGDIIAECYKPVDARPSGCVDELTYMLPYKKNYVKTNLDAVDAEIDRRFGTALPVYHSLYPQPLDNGSSRNPPVCIGDDYLARGEVGLGAPDDFVKNNVSQGEADFLFGLLADLNGVIADRAGRGWNLVGEPAFGNHGLCTSNNFVNLNSDGLHTQGYDLDSAVPLSAGFFHPNDKGYEKYADEMMTAFGPTVKARLVQGLVAPLNLRVAAADYRGNITLAWNDRSTTEDFYQVEVTPLNTASGALLARPPTAVSVGSAGGFLDSISGKDLQTYTHLAGSVGAGYFKYRVRACATSTTSGVSALCGPFSTVEGTNEPPPTPTGLTVSSYVAKTSTTYTWRTAMGAMEYVLRLPAQSGGTEYRTTSTTFKVLGDRKTAQVAACNRAGCSPFSSSIP